VELPKPPWYRRFWVVVLAVNLAFAATLVAAVVVLWPRAAPRPRHPATTAAAGPRVEQVVPDGSGSGTTPPTSTRARLESAVLWQQRGRDLHVGGLFRAPGSWRVVWSFSCRSFAEHGGGNFKLSGAGDFEDVSVQRFGVKGSGTLQVTGGGRGRLIIESVCERWMITAVAP
jgi:hypothetical protein